LGWDAYSSSEEQKDVFLDEFADTDEEVEDDEDEETTLRKEERRQVSILLQLQKPARTRNH